MNGPHKTGFTRIQYFSFPISRWLALFLAVWLGSLVQARAEGPVANNQTNSTAVLSQRYGIRLSYANPAGGPVTFQLLDAPDGTLKYWSSGSGDYEPVATNVAINTDYWYYWTDATEPGEDYFVWEVRDEHDNASSATAVVNLTSNTPVALVSQTNTLAVGSVRAHAHHNHIDPDWNQVQHYQLIEAPTRGTLEYRSDWSADDWQPVETNTWYSGGVWEYTPLGTDTGEDHFVWRVSDGLSTSETATVAYVLTANTPPVARDQTLTIAVGTVRRSLWLSYTDPDWNQPFAYQLVVPPEKGILEYSDGDGYHAIVSNEWVSVRNWLYTPTNDTADTDAIVWRMSDGLATSETATVSVTINANTPPVANDQTLAMLAGQVRSLTLSYTDPDSGQVFSFRLTDPPSHGFLEYSFEGEYVPVPTNTYIGSRSWRYTPDPAFVGTDSFQWTVSDGLAESATPGTYTLNVNTNTPPVAYGLRLVGPPDTAMIKAARFIDPDTGQTRTAHITDSPEHGSLTVSGTTFTYTPTNSFMGEDSFTYTVFDGVDYSNEALARIQVRESDDRAGNLILVIVRDTLYPNISNEVHRLEQDLIAEGYTAAVHTRPSDSTLNLWTHIKGVYDNTDHWLEGALLIGNLPRPRLNAYHAYHKGYRNMYTDLPLWNMNFYQTEDSANVSDFRIWVGRFYAAGNSYGDELTLLQRALDANHAARTGKARLPHTAYYYHAWENRAYMGANLAQTWPSVAVTNEVGTNSDKKYAAHFDPPRNGAEIGVAGGADALVYGGDIFQETSHGNAGGYMYAKFNRAHLMRVLSQQRYGMIESCTVGAYNGIVNHHILTRGGGTLFAVGGSDINYVGDFQTASGWGNAVHLRARLAEGETWGSALLRHYAFRALNRTLFYGDLSLPAMASPSNAMPRIVSFVREPAGPVYPGEPVSFSIQVDDPDALLEDSPHVDFNHQVEWFMNGYNAGQNDPTYTTNDTQCVAWTNVTHSFPAAGTYTVRAEVMDEWQARGWKEITVTVTPYAMEIVSFAQSSTTFMNAGETLTFAIEATDPGGGGLTYAWKADGVSLPGTESSLDWTAPSGFSRAYVLRATAYDTWGSSVAHEWTVEVAGEPVPVGPVGYWRLDEESGTRADASGLGNHLADHGDVGFADGTNGNAAAFGGSNWLAIPDEDQTHLNVRDAFTVAAWIRPEAVDGTRMIMSKYNYGNSQRSWRFQLESGKMRFYASAAGTDNTYVTGNATLSADHWRHVAVVYKAGSVRFYLDGALDRATSVSVTRLFDSSAPFALGANFNGGSATQFFQGRIDEARMFRRTLSDAEIAALAAGGNQPPIAVDDTAATPENQPVWIDVLANDGDPDGDGLTVTGAGPAAHGAVAVTADPDGVQYTPNTGFTGADAFAYTISDPHGAAATGAVHVLVVGAVPMTVAPNGVGMNFSFTVVSNWKYRVEYKDDLLAPDGWRELYRGVADADETIDIMDDEPCAQRFYRIQVRP